ncbi:hypothetical protein G7046_g188 [Stylonectria norvegica]|nr:hypothetical protein G7046_g188 [Stylonectria norvegica]
MRDEFLDTTGTLTYGGRPAHTNDPDPVRLTFCAEEDAHLPMLTVRQTLRFVFALRALGISSNRLIINPIVEDLANCYGLGHVLETNIGNEKIRGISGGEARRVSLSEATATLPEVFCLDNPTNGLDSSTAIQVIQMLRDYTIQSKCSTVMSIYQGSDGIVSQFDKMIIINSGRQIFYGAPIEATAYFESLGFERLERTTISDFLSSMTGQPEQRRVRDGWELRVPQSPEDFETAFRKSPHYSSLTHQIAAQKSSQVSIGPRRSKYALSLSEQAVACALRQFRILFTDYWSWGYLKQPASLSRRDLVIRQRSYRFYRPLAYSMGLILTDLPWKLLAIVYCIPQYLLTGFQQSGDRFFTWFVVLYVEFLALSMIFRAIATLSKSPAKAVLPVGLFFNMVVIYTGIYVPIPQMQVWLGWLRYLSPMYYGFESIVVNEIGSLSYECSTADILPSGPGYSAIENQACGVPGGLPGTLTVSGELYVMEHYGFQLSHLWRNVGINAAVFIAFGILTCIGMERYKLPSGHLATVYYASGHLSKSREQDSLPFDSENGVSDPSSPPVQKASDPSGSSTTDEKPAELHTQRSQVLTWQDICLEVQHEGSTKQLLQHLSGEARPGQLTALMGASGAGKTTLLNVLAGRSTFGKLQGSISVNGQELLGTLNKSMGYVQQRDVHLPTQTVKEALEMTHRLRGPRSLGAVDEERHITSIIEKLQLEDIAHAMIGTSGAGLNLEQRKRVTIAVELSASPAILFLDEPTSGLDGQSALKIVQLLRGLADAGQTIICTIHQPSMEVFSHFDRLVLLLRGGKLAYDGPLGERCATILDYFGKHSRPAEPNQNAAEYLIEVVDSAPDIEPHRDWADIWVSSSSGIHHQAEKPKSKDAGLRRSEPVDSGAFAASFIDQFTTVLKRTWRYSWRDPDYLISKMLMTTGNALLNGLTFLNSPNTERGAYNRLFSVFMSMIVAPPLGLQVIPRFINLQEIFIFREKDSRTYHWIVFVLCAIIIEIPYSIISGLVYWLLWYYPVGYFQEVSRAGYSLLMYQLFSIFFHSLAQLCAAGMPNLNSALSANGFMFMFVNTFAGTLSPKPNTPSGWRWYFDVSPLFYLTEGVTSNAMYGLELACTESEGSLFQPPTASTCQAYAEEFLSRAPGYLMNPDAMLDCRYCHYATGQSYYEQYGYSFDHRWRNLRIFIGFIAFNYSAVIALTYFTKIFAP